MPAQPDRTRPDVCPGAIAVHQAADGGLARIRVPGGMLTNAQLRAVSAASSELGSGGLELTSRANIQVRGLPDGAEAELADRLWQAGLLPSLSHERVRNIIASPLGNDQHLVDSLDRALCAEPSLAGLPGRFLITVDDGRGDVSGLGGDIGLYGNAFLLAGVDTGLRFTDPVPLVIAAALEFLTIRGDAWRVCEIPDGVQRIAAVLGTPGPGRVTVPAPTPAPVGRTEGVTVAGVPLGRLTGKQADVLCDIAPWVRLTPWRSVVVPGHTETGLITDPSSPWLGVTACTGRPGCAKSLADVQADAAAWIPGRVGDTPVHWSGCDRRCGRPAGQVVEMIATDAGYRRNG